MVYRDGEVGRKEAACLSDRGQLLCIYLIYTFARMMMIRFDRRMASTRGLVYCFFVWVFAMLPWVLFVTHIAQQKKKVALVAPKGDDMVMTIGSLP